MSTYSGGPYYPPGGGQQPPPVYFKAPTLEEWLQAYWQKVERRKKHIDWLAIVMIIVGVLYIVLGLGLGAFMITAPAWDHTMNAEDRVVVPIVGIVILVVCIVFGTWPAVNAWGLRSRKEWGRWSTIVFCALTSPMACGSICCLPVTIWGIWALVGPEADGVFGKEPKPPDYLVQGQPGQAPQPQAQPETYAPFAAYDENQKPSGRTPIPQIYPRPRVSSKTPAQGLYRYEPKGASQESEDEKPHSYSSYPTVKDIHKPDPDKKR
jgi:hypothetical protein